MTVVRTRFGNLFESIAPRDRVGGAPDEDGADAISTEPAPAGTEAVGDASVGAAVAAPTAESASSAEDRERRVRAGIGELRVEAYARQRWDIVRYVKGRIQEMLEPGAAPVDGDPRRTALSGLEAWRDDDARAGDRWIATDDLASYLERAAECAEDAAACAEFDDAFRECTSADAAAWLKSFASRNGAAARELASLCDDPDVVAFATKGVARVSESDATELAGGIVALAKAAGARENELRDAFAWFVEGGGDGAPPTRVDEIVEAARHRANEELGRVFGDGLRDGETFETAVERIVGDRLGGGGALAELSRFREIVAALRDSASKLLGAPTDDPFRACRETVRGFCEDGSIRRVLDVCAIRAEVVDTLKKSGRMLPHGDLKLVDERVAGLVRRVAGVNGDSCEPSVIGEFAKAVERAYDETDPDASVQAVLRSAVWADAWADMPRTKAQKALDEAVGGLSTNACKSLAKAIRDSKPDDVIKYAVQCETIVKLVSDKGAYDKEDRCEAIVVEAKEKALGVLSDVAKRVGDHVVRQQRANLNGIEQSAPESFENLLEILSATERSKDATTPVRFVLCVKPFGDDGTRVNTQRVLKDAGCTNPGSMGTCTTATVEGSKSIATHKSFYHIEGNELDDGTNAIHRMAKSDTHMLITGQTDKQLFVYTGYGNSGSGKTYTLVESPRSILSAVLEAALENHAVVDVAVTDYYAEHLETDGSCVDPRQLSKPLVPERDFAETQEWTLSNGSFDSGRRSSVRSSGSADIVFHPWLESSRESHTSEDRNAKIAACTHQITKMLAAKKSKDFGGLRNLPWQQYHVRTTPYNPNSSRAHCAIVMKLKRARGDSNEFGRIAIIDMAGNEDVDAIQKQYFESVDVDLIRARVQPHFKTIDEWGRDKWQALLGLRGLQCENILKAQPIPYRLLYTFLDARGDDTGRPEIIRRRVLAMKPEHETAWKNLEGDKYAGDSLRTHAKIVLGNRPFAHEYGVMWGGYADIEHILVTLHRLQYDIFKAPERTSFEQALVSNMEGASGSKPKKIAHTVKYWSSAVKAWDEANTDEERTKAVTTTATIPGMSVEGNAGTLTNKDRPYVQALARAGDIKAIVEFIRRVCDNEKNGTFDNILATKNACSASLAYALERLMTPLLHARSQILEKLLDIAEKAGANLPSEMRILPIRLDAIDQSQLDNLSGEQRDPRDKPTFRFVNSVKGSIVDVINQRHHAAYSIDSDRTTWPKFVQTYCTIKGEVQDELKRAYNAALESIAACHCPLRRQGVAIQASIKESKKFMKKMSEFDQTEPPRWMTSIVGALPGHEKLKIVNVLCAKPDPELVREVALENVIEMKR